MLTLFIWLLPQIYLSPVPQGRALGTISKEEGWRSIWNGIGMGYKQKGTFTGDEKASVIAWNKMAEFLHRFMEVRNKWVP